MGSSFKASTQGHKSSDSLGCFTFIAFILKLAVSMWWAKFQDDEALTAPDIRGTESFLIALAIVPGLSRAHSHYWSQE